MSALDSAELLKPLKRLLQRQLTGHNESPIRVAVACSGGVDSMSLAHALVSLSRATHEAGAMALTPVIFTVDHRLHERSQEWAERVTAHWRGEGVEAHHLYADQALIKEGQGLEDGARRARYAALSEAAQAQRCTLVLLAHHAQDQAETLLMRLQGPTGVRGLAGIPALRGHFARPWLTEERELIVRYADERGLPVFEDPSNADPRWLRNRVRQALPELARCFEPQWTLRVAQSALQAREYIEGARWFIARSLEGKVYASSHRVTLTWPEGLEMPEVAQRAALLMVWEAAWRRFRDERLDARRLHDHLTPLQALWRGARLAQRQLPQGLWAWGKGGTLTIDSRLEMSDQQRLEGHDLFLTQAPSDVLWGGWRLTVSLAREGTRDPHSIPLCRAPLPWRLRAPRQGERLHLLGAPGSKPLGQLWAREGVPPIERSRLPVLVDADEVIIWAPHLRPADHLRGGAGGRWVPRWTPVAPLTSLELTSPE